MPTATSGYSSSQISSYQRWLRQYRATHGRNPPEHMVSSFLRGQVEAGAARAERGRLIGLQEATEERLATGQARGLALRGEELEFQKGTSEKEFAARRRAEERLKEDREQALATQKIQGYTQIGLATTTTGIEAAKLYGIGNTTTAVATPVTSSTAAAPVASGAGTGYEGAGLAMGTSSGGGITAATVGAETGFGGAGYSSAAGGTAGATSGAWLAAGGAGAAGGLIGGYAGRYTAEEGYLGETGEENPRTAATIAGAGTGALMGGAATGGNPAGFIIGGLIGGAVANLTYK